LNIPSAKSLSEALFNLDPLGTCCKENDAIDEYDKIAEDIVAEMTAGSGLINSVRVVFERWFGVETISAQSTNSRIMALPDQINFYLMKKSTP